MDPLEVVYTLSRISSIESLVSNYPIPGIASIVGCIVGVVALLSGFKGGSRRNRTLRVVGLLALCVLLVGCYFAIRSTIQITRKDVYNIVAAAFSMAKDQQEHTHYLTQDGASTEDVIYTIRAIGQPVPTLEEMYQVVSGPQSNGLGKEIKVPDRVECVDQGRTMTLVRVDTTGAQIRALYDIHPDLGAGAATRMRQPMQRFWPPGTFAMRKAQLSVGRTDEFSVFQAFYPTDKITLQVVFPEDLAPRSNSVHAEVWYGLGRVSHPAEQKRLDDAVRAKSVLKSGRHDDGGIWFALTIDYPLPSLYYAIVWVPHD